MYKIVCAGEVIAICDEPRYVKVSETNGANVRCPMEEATGIVVDGVYHSRVNTFAKEIDGGEYAFSISQRVQDNEDVNSIVFVTLAENETIDEVTASEHPSLFADWEENVSYAAGNIRKYEENLYKCLQAHTSQSDWTPDTAVSLWKKIGDPTEEWPEWSQPIGAGDAYMKDDKVSHNGTHWVSTCDNNVWEPGVYGWEAVL